MDLGHTEARVPEKALQSVHPRLRLLIGNFRIGSFGKASACPGPRSTADRDHVLSERVVGTFIVGPTSRGYHKRSPSPHGFFNAQCFSNVDHTFSQPRASHFLFGK